MHYLFVENVRMALKYIVRRCQAFLTSALLPKEQPLSVQQITEIFSRDFKVHCNKSFTRINQTLMRDKGFKC